MSVRRAVSDAPASGHLRRELRELREALVRAVSAAAPAVVRGLWRARLVVFAASSYMVVASYLALHSDLLVLDALSRTAHAWLVWNDHPSKLANIGFVWPPVTSLTLLPVTIVSPLARSALAAPLVSSIGMACALSVAWHALGSFGVPRLARAAAVTLVAVNPVIVFYAANGMSEVWGLLLPTVALVALLMWHRRRTMTPLAISSFAAMLAMMSRYELGVLPVLLAGTVMLSVRARDADGRKAWAVGLFSLLPSIYALGAWMFFNWSVQGSPIWFLTSGGQIGTVAGTASTVGSTKAVEGLGRLASVGYVLGAQAALSPLLVVTLVALCVWTAVTRRWFALAVAVFAGSNLLTNVGVVLLTHSAWMVNLRFNMRGMLIALVAAGWLVFELRDAGRPRLARAWVAVSLALLAIGLPSATLMMRDYPVQFDERLFIRVLHDDRRLDGTATVDGNPVGCDGARAMGRWISQNVQQEDSVLADDSSSYGVLLFSGVPERFVNRGDLGDRYFQDQLARPSRRTRFLLASNFTDCSGVGDDLVSARFGGVPSGATPGLRTVHATHGFTLYSIDRNRLGEAPA